MLVVAAIVVPIGWSYTGYLTAPGDAPVSVRSVDFLREHGLATVVDRVEQWWYTRSPPAGRLAPAGDLPSGSRPGSQQVGDSRLTTPSVPLTVTPAQAGEGVWRAVTGLATRAAGVSETFIRPDATHPSVAADIVRFDQHATRLVLVPGMKEPGGAPWAWGSGIPRAQRPKVVAAFNAGFKFADTPGGLFSEGRTAVRPLQAGLASIVIRRDGTADVAQWGRDASMNSDIVSVRQNLDLVVDQGRPVAGLITNRAGQWGTTQSQLQYTWRSGLGIDSKGRLLYVAGRQMSLTELASALTDAGAVRGMQLDIHPVVSFNWFRPDAASALGVTASKLVPSMHRDATRYLSPEQRDFLTVLAR
jgi:hypothetical protein